jgi:hypothetical protein
VPVNVAGGPAVSSVTLPKNRCALRKGKNPQPGRHGKCGRGKRWSVIVSAHRIFAKLFAIQVDFLIPKFPLIIAAT